MQLVICSSGESETLPGMTLFHGVFHQLVYQIGEQALQHQTFTPEACFSWDISHGRCCLPGSCLGQGSKLRVLHAVQQTEQLFRKLADVLSGRQCCVCSSLIILCYHFVPPQF